MNPHAPRNRDVIEFPHPHQHRPARPKKTEDHKAKATLSGLVEILEDRDLWDELPFALNEMENAVFVCCPDPYKDCDNIPDGFVPKFKLRRPLTDEDITTLRIFLESKCNFKPIPKELVYDAVRLVAARRSFHPVRDWLGGLTWDGQSRVGTWLRRYLGAEDSEYTWRIGAMWLVAMIARVMEPGCKADHLLVLEGPQGSGKSTACSILGGDYFSDQMPDAIGGKDASIHLRGKWLIELAELSVVGKRASEELKAFISRTEERFRAPYERMEKTEPRQMVFIGTTNQASYLKDETGARRFWPVKTDQIDLEALKADRAQLFAEARTMYEKGVRWWPDAEFERQFIKPQQEGRYDEDPWAPLVRDWWQRQPDDARARTDQIAFDACSVPHDRLTKRESNRLAAILRKMGSPQKTINGTRYWTQPPTGA